MAIISQMGGSSLECDGKDEAVPRNGSGLGMAQA